MSYFNHIQTQLDGINIGEKRDIEYGQKDRRYFNSVVAAIALRNGWKLRTRKIGYKIYVQRYDNNVSPFKNPTTKDAKIECQIRSVAVGVPVDLDITGVPENSFRVILSNICERLCWKYKTKTINGVKRFWRLS